MAGADGMQKMLPESPPRRKNPLHPMCARTAFSCNKLLLFIYAVLFLFVGIVLAAIGVLVEMHRSRVESVNNTLSWPTALLILVGLIIAINALCGVVGTITENPFLLKIFLVTTIICFLLQVAIGIVAFIFREELPDMMSPDLSFAIEGYGHKKGYRKTIDWLQETYECCGFSSYIDYRTYNEEYSCDSGLEKACGVPESCCRKRTGVELPPSCGYGIHENSTLYDTIHVEGCKDAFIQWLMEHLDLVGAFALGFAIPQIFGILLSYYFLRKVQEYRVWYRVDNFRG